MARKTDGILEAVRELLPGGDGTAAGALDEVTRYAERALARWIEARARTGSWREREHDRVGVVGRPVELAMRMDGDAAADLEVTFFVDGQAVGTGYTMDQGTAVCTYVPRTPGLHLVTTAIRNASGERDPVERRPGRLQVVGDGPVVVIDARLLDRHAPAELQPLRDLHRRGVAMCWADLEAIEATATRDAEIAAAGLPPTAVLSVAARSRDFEALGVDFAPVTTRLTVRRLRAAGVPLVAAVSAAPMVGDSAAAGLMTLTLPQLAARLAAPDGLAPLIAAAAQFVAARDQAHGAAALARRLDLMTQTRAVAGNAVELALDNHAARVALLADLEGAQHRIHLQFYMLEPGRFATELVACLRRRAAAGVAVRLVVDSLYAGHELLGRVNPVLAELDLPNIEIVASDPISLATGVDIVRLKQRDHRKLAIIDDAVAYVTGRNGADEYYLGFDEVAIDDTTTHDAIPWFDAHARLRGPLVAELQRIFLANWRRNGGAEVAPAAAPPPPPAAAGEVTARVVLHDGITDAYALAAYEALFGGARERLIVVNDFPIIADLAAALIGAAQRGVRVDILTGNGLARRGDGTFFDGPRYRELFEYMVKRCYEPLLRAGVRVAEYAAPALPNITARGGAIRPYVHAKVVVVDGCVVSVGTANLDATASHWEREVNLVIESRPVATALTAELDAILARAFVIDPASAYWQAEAPRRALASRLWPESLYS